MNKQEFLREVEKQAPPEYKGGSILKEAVNFFEIANAGEFYKRNIPTVIQIAGRLKINFNSQEEKEEENNKTKGLGLTSQNIIESDYLTEKITPWAEEVRLEIFGNKKPPFEKDSWQESLKAAEAWLREKAEAPLPEETQRKIDRFSREYKRISKLQRENAIIGNFAIKANFIDFPGGDGWVIRFPVRGHKELETIEKEVKKISNASGFKKHALTAFILTGLEPIISRATVTSNNYWHQLPNGEALARKNVVIEINSPDLTFNELKEIYNQYRQRMKSKKKKPLSEEHLRLFYIVKNNAPPPEKGNCKQGEWTSYWKHIANEWKGSPEKYMAAYMAYKRIIEKLESSH